MSKKNAKKNTVLQKIQPQGNIRLIGGAFRGRKLPVLTQEGLRPTSDRVKETLFNWLQFDVPQARCLDAFAGSGSLGFEALSRGALDVTFLERMPAVVKQLQHNLQMLEVPPAQARVYQTDTLAYLATECLHSFDIVFIDPPFHQGLMQSTLDLVFKHHWIQDSGWLYLEQENTQAWPILPENWICHREKTTSQVKYGLFTRNTI